MMNTSSLVNVVCSSRSRRTHPDRLTKATDSEKKVATEKFQVSLASLRNTSNIRLNSCPPRFAIVRQLQMHTMSSPTPREGMNTTYSILQDPKQTRALTQKPRPTSSVNSLVCLAAQPLTTHPRTVAASRGLMLKTFSLTYLMRYEFSLKIHRGYRAECNQAPSPRSGTAHTVVVLPWHCVWWRWVAPQDMN